MQASANLKAEQNPANPLIPDWKEPAPQAGTEPACGKPTCIISSLVVALIGAGIGVLAWQLTKASSKSSINYTAEQRSCGVFCHGPLLRLVQTTPGIFNDSKEFVDMPMKVSPELIHSSFKAAFPELAADPLASQPANHPAGNVSRERVVEFLGTYFGQPGGGLISGGTPPDWMAQPSVATSQPNATIRAFVLGANDVWKVLYRETNATLFPGKKPSSQSSLLPPANPVIVPGERFREQYYWDTLWIVRGLIRSGMVATAQGMVENLVAFVERYGFVPNGGRVYYLQRSQPPVLALMVEMVASAIAGDTIAPEVGPTLRQPGNTAPYPEAALGFVTRALAALETEYSVFMGTKPYSGVAGGQQPQQPHQQQQAEQVERHSGEGTMPEQKSRMAASGSESREQSSPVARVQNLQMQPEDQVPVVAYGTHALRIAVPQNDRARLLSCSDHGGAPNSDSDSDSGSFYRLNRYTSRSVRPRPESYYEDVESAAGAGLLPNSTAAGHLFRSISSGAETGWDFSSRWNGASGAMSRCRADEVVPVDLNVILFKMEAAMARMYGRMASTWVTVSALHGGAAWAAFSESRESYGQRAQALRDAAMQRAVAMDCLLWDELTRSWKDLVVRIDQSGSGIETRSEGYASAGVEPSSTSGYVNATAVGRSLYVTSSSDFFPLWGLGIPASNGSVWSGSQHQGSGSVPGRSQSPSFSFVAPAPTLVANGTRIRLAVEGLFGSGLLQAGGVLTTNLTTGQQWDAPNSWPPVLHVLASGLSRAEQVLRASKDRISGSAEAPRPQAEACARELSRRYLDSASCAWRETGYLFEKYDAVAPCAGGGGGEYVPQRGFGWTLGVALDLAASYQWQSLEQGPGVAIGNGSVLACQPMA